MATAHTSAGYTGSVDQSAEANRFALGGGGRFRVASSADWAVAVSTSVNRTVTISSGKAAACGVWDSTGATDSVAVAANGGGTDRYDAIVASFDWTAMTVAFGVIAGTTSVPQVNTSSAVVDLAKINRIPGLRYDALLAVVRVRPGVALLSSGDLTDCRVYGDYQTSSAALTHAALLDVDPGHRVIFGTAGYQKNADATFTASPRFYVQTGTPSGTIPDGSVWFKI